MIDQISHDQIIAKIQHFADNLQQRKLDKEILSILIEDKPLKSDILNEILIYEEIIQEYYDDFRNILTK